ncbi:disulfide bond formation protein DsbB [Ferrimonas gelatinilytica]|uniref:Disulfide bond formation protein B n=1 Tax=Ferrimonas gelatinilytica TaxID=1255257 RepID=A0ABP9RV38_9GAMM
MVQVLSQFSQHRSSWSLLLLSCVLLFAIALYFQHGMALEPCLYCIYIRVAVIAVALSALIGLLQPRTLITAWLSFVSWIVSAAWGLWLALELVEKQSGNAPTGLFGASCDYIPNFPAWMPLHQWWPALFQPQGQCSDEAWQWLGVTMAQWMVGVFALYLALALLFALARTVASRQPH